MEQERQKRLFAEINGYMDADSTKLAEKERAHLAATYFEPEQLRRERALFQRLPLAAGHGSRIPKAGDFLAHDDSGVPLLLVRQPDGKVKAFLNACRHRGAKVCHAAQGNQSRFTCPYHGWTYKADGALLAVNRTGFPNTAVDQHGLTELPCEERHGILWVVLTPGSPLDVAGWLGPLDAELAAYPLGDYVLEREVALREDINWKFVLDGFLEIYHFPTLHKESIAPFFHGRFSPFDSVGQHSRLVAARKSFDGVREGGFESSDFLKHVAVNYQIFPNSIFVWQGDHFELWSCYPAQTPDRCVVRIQVLVPRERSGPEWKSRWDKNWKILIDTVQQEDWEISREVQRALPYVEHGQVLFGRNEPGLQHFHGVLEQALEGS